MLVWGEETVTDFFQLTEEQHSNECISICCCIVHSLMSDSFFCFSVCMSAKDFQALAAPYRNQHISLEGKDGCFSVPCLPHYVAKLSSSFGFQRYILLTDIIICWHLLIRYFFLVKKHCYSRCRIIYWLILSSVDQDLRVLVRKLQCNLASSQCNSQ